MSPLPPGVQYVIIVSLMICTHNIQGNKCTLFPKNIFLIFPHDAETNRSRLIMKKNVSFSSFLFLVILENCVCLYMI